MPTLTDAPASFLPPSLSTRQAKDAGVDALVKIVRGNAVKAAIRDATISNNWAFRDGGGVLLESMYAATFTGCTIADNEAWTGYGGGVTLYGGGRSNDVGDSPLVTLSSSTISGNSAQYGGGLAEICEEDDYDQYFGTCAQYFLKTDNTITSNEARSAGGGVSRATRASASASRDAGCKLLN